MCAQGMVLDLDAGRSDALPSPAEDSLVHFVLSWISFRSLDGGTAVAWPWVPACWNRLGKTVKTR